MFIKMYLSDVILLRTLFINCYYPTNKLKQFYLNQHADPKALLGTFVLQNSIH